jgi:outer membrane protein OmpA-like peptidoglycan-associated protein
VTIFKEEGMAGRKFRSTIILAAGLLMLLPLGGHAGETRKQQYILGDNTERIFIEGIRPMAMGGAFVAVANDENALFYNPAGLARINYWRFTLPNWTYGTDTRSFDDATYLLGKQGDFSNLMNGQAIPADTASRLSNARVHETADLNFSYIQPGWGFGGWVFSDALAQTGAIVLPEASWNARAGLIEDTSFGWGFDLPSAGTLAFGLGFKAIQQGQTIAEDKNIADIKNPDVRMSWGGGVDLGVLYQPTTELSFGVMVADLYTRILEEVQVPNLKVGFAYKPHWLNFEDLGTTLALDFVELNWQGDNEFKNNPTNASVVNLSKMRVGLEFVLSGLIALRGGFYEGYPTAGVSLTTGFINVEWAYFGRELGTYPGQDPEWNNRFSVNWHCGGPVAPPPTPTPTVTATATATPTISMTPTPRPTPQPTMTGKIPKLHGIFVGFTGNITTVPKLPENLGEVRDWTFEIKDTQGIVVKTYRGTGTPPNSFIWDGKRQGQRASSKERYPFTLSLTCLDGLKTVTGNLVISDTIPKLYTSKNYEIFPDKVYFSIRQPLENTKTWKLDIFDNANSLVRSFQSTEPLWKAFSWDAKDTEGNVVPNNGNYRYELSITDAADNQIIIADRLRPVKGQVYPNENGITIKIGEILFDTGKAYLTAEMFDKVIKSAYLVQDEQASDAVINGHTDAQGNLKLNMKLSLVRAESVRRFLVEEQNVSAYQMTIKGWGPTKPIATNRTDAGRQTNRRVEVIIRVPR